MESSWGTTRAAWRPRRAARRRALARTLTSFLLLLASLAGSAQRAIAAGCTGSATAGVAAWPSMSRLDATTAAASDAAPPAANPGEAPHPVASCAGSAALPTVVAAAAGSLGGGRQPIGLTAIFRGAEAPEPLLGPPRQG